MCHIDMSVCIGARIMAYTLIFSFISLPIANFLEKHMEDADHIALTDMLDNLVFDFEDSMTFPDQKLLLEILPHLIPIQQEEKMALDIVMVFIYKMNYSSNELEHRSGMTIY